MAQLLTISHNIFQQNDINSIVTIFGDRLNNELTREASLKGLTLMARNKANTINLQNISSLIPQFIDLLHKALRQVQLSTLEAILALLERYSQQF